MKNFCFLFFALLLMTSCGNTYIYDGAQMRTINVHIDADEWQYTQQGDYDQFNNNYFYAFVNMPEITREAFDAGEVKAYVVQDRGSYTYARKHLLPYVLHAEEKNVYGEWVFYTQTIDFTYGIGWAEFNFRMSDFAYEEDVTINPPAMEFDIVITYPQE